MFKVGQVVYKAGDYSHPEIVRAGTLGVITRQPNRDSPYFLIKYEGTFGTGLNGEWHCTEKGFYTLGNRFTNQIEEVMCFPDGKGIGTYGCALSSVSDIIGADLFFPNWCNWWDGEDDEKVSIITLLSIVDDETMDAIIQELK